MVASKLTNKMKSGVYTADAFMGAVEAILLAVIGRAAAWVASIPCAVITAKACATFFELTWPWAMAVAVALELVGQTTSSLWLNAKEWNANKRQSDPAANEGLALALMICYFTADFTIIAMLTIPPVLAGGELSGLTALLFPVLAVVSVIALNERVTQYKREADVAQEKAMASVKRKERRQAKRQVAQAVSSVGINAQPLTAEGRRAQLLDIWRQGSGQTFAQLAPGFGVSRQTISNDFATLRKAGKVKRNGRGVEVLA